MFSKVQLGICILQRDVLVEMKCYTIHDPGSFIVKDFVGDILIFCRFVLLLKETQTFYLFNFIEAYFQQFLYYIK